MNDDDSNDDRNRKLQRLWLARALTRKDPSLNRIRSIIKSDPGIVKDRADRGLTFLHLACANHFMTNEVIEFLVEACPESVFCLSEHCHRLPLHMACEKNCSLPIIQTLVQHCPESLQVPDVYGELPLHKAAQSSISLETIQFLVDQYPEAIQIKDSRGDLPIHCALRGQYFASQHEVVQYLANAYPKGLSTRGHKGNLPLHWACQGNASLAIIQYLVDLCPSSVQIANDGGKLPVWIACMADPLPNIMDVLNYLAQKTPTTMMDPAVLLSDHLLYENIYQNNHYKDFYCKDIQVVHCLINRFPHLAKLKSPKGTLPLHVVCQHALKSWSGDTMIPILTAIIKAYPTALLVPRDVDKMTTLEYVRQKNGPKQMQQFLEEQMKEVLWTTTKSTMEGHNVPKDVFHHHISNYVI